VHKCDTKYCNYSFKATIDPYQCPRRRLRGKQPEMQESIAPLGSLYCMVCAGSHNRAPLNNIDDDQVDVFAQLDDEPVEESEEQLRQVPSVNSMHAEVFATSQTIDYQQGETDKQTLHIHTWFAIIA